jgi:hypothetical protein
MNPLPFIFSVPIVAIVGGLLVGVIKMFLEASERRFQIRMSAQQSVSDKQDDAIKALRDEFAAFREAATAYDLTVEDKLKRIEDQLARSASTIPRPTLARQDGEDHQTVGTRE